LSRREQIQMGEEEILAFLAEERIVTCATIGRDAWPHLMPLWFVVRDGDIWAWTFAKSQKVKNLERDNRATIQVEAGDEYHELRGVMMKTRVELVRDLEAVTDLGTEIMARYAGGNLDEGGRAFIEAQAAKRVGLHFIPEEKATWDHRKLGGVY
jgi:nitroimidazol reductase NimA-like FMN-containing flavoprotein (pyridoxamine 5'-phosphate oxidase superfamily)